MAAVLLLYYPGYAQVAVTTLLRFLRQLGGLRTLLIVHNGQWALPPLPAEAIVLPGDNHQREFSGWQVALQHLRARRLMPDRGVLVLANDTFCLHNRFGPVSRRCFAQGFQKLARTSDPALAGEIYGLRQPYRILGLASAGWASTHLIGMNQALYERLPGFTLPDEQLQACYQAPDPAAAGASPSPVCLAPGSEGLAFSDAVSANLARHIVDWLLGRGRHRWYGATPGVQASAAVLRQKANAILLEKLLSARCTAAGAQMIDVMSHPLHRLARRLERPAVRPRLQQLGQSETQVRPAADT